MSKGKNEEEFMGCCSDDEGCSCTDEDCSTCEEDCCEDDSCGCSCGCGDEDGEEEDSQFFIDPERVLEIEVFEDGMVRMVVLDEEDKEQEVALEFPSVEEAEAWLKESFGDDVLDDMEEVDEEEEENK